MKRPNFFFESLDFQWWTLRVSKKMFNNSFFSTLQKHQALGTDPPSFSHPAHRSSSAWNGCESATRPKKGYRYPVFRIPEHCRYQLPTDRPQNVRASPWASPLAVCWTRLPGLVLHRSLLRSTYTFPHISFPSCKSGSVRIRKFWPIRIRIQLRNGITVQIQNRIPYVPVITIKEQASGKKRREKKGTGTLFPHKKLDLF